MNLSLDLPSILGLFVGVGYVWLLVAAILDCATSPRSDMSKINWITLVLVLPVGGMLLYLCFGGAHKKEKRAEVSIIKEAQE
jgi:hypothetical protein